MTNPGKPTQVITVANFFETQPPALHYMSNSGIAQTGSASVVAYFRALDGCYNVGL